MIYIAENIKCPFYKEENKNTIKCEGLFSPELTNNFLTAKKKQEYREAHCCVKYMECELYKANEKK